MADAAVLEGLEPADDVLSRLKKRRDRRKDVLVSDPVDLHFRWEEAGYGNPEGGFYMKIDGKDMLLTSGAEKTASQIIGQKDSNWHKRYQDPDFFPKAFRNFSHKAGFMIRHDGHNVQAVLSENYRIRDAYDLLVEDFLPLVSENIGEIRGIGHTQEGDGDLDSLRVVLGSNIVPGVNDRYGQYLMFLLSTSDNGLYESKTWLGMYRSASASASLRGQTAAKWTHKSSPEKFMARTSDTVRNMAYYQGQFAKVMEALARAPLPIGADNDPLPATDVLLILRKGGLLSQSHYDAAKIYANSLTEDGRPCTSQYDVFNACGRGAQDLLNPNLRHKAEEATMLIFTEPGGLAEQLRRAIEKTPDAGILAGNP